MLRHVKTRHVETVKNGQIWRRFSSTMLCCHRWPHPGGNAGANGQNIEKHLVGTMKSGTCDLWLVDFYFLGWLWKPSFATQQKSWFPRFGKAVVLWLDSKIHSFRDIVSTCFHCKAPWIPWQELAGHAITLDFRWFSNGLVSILDHNVWNFPSGVMLSSVITLRSSNKKLKTHAVHKLRQEQWKAGISVNTPQWVSLSLHISLFCSL